MKNEELSVENMMKKFLLMMLVLLGLSACNTIQGIGKDVKRAGEVVENAGRK